MQFSFWYMNFMGQKKYREKEQVYIHRAVENKTNTAFRTEHEQDLNRTQLS